MNENDDELLFDASDDEEAIPQSPENTDCWKLLIVDDDKEVHQITKLTLVNFRFEDKSLEFLHAYSAQEALPIIKDNPDIALILLDVVMETRHAGLDLVHKIREQANNQLVRIVLRTGQPGEAPERDIIANYDINDYADKTELSAQKLFTVVVASLRAYRDILKLENSRKDLLISNQQLSAARKRIQVTLDSIGDAVMTTDAAGKVTHLNPVAEQLTGWNLSEAKGKDIKTIFPIVDATTGKEIDNPIEKVIATGETVYLSNHTTLISKTGKQYQIADSAAAICDENNEIVGMVLVFNDVTEQYRLREIAAKSKYNLQTIMDYSPAVIYAKDINGRYIFVNQKYESLFQLSSDEIIGKTDYDIFSENFAKKFQANDKAVLAAGRAFEYEESAPLKDGVHHYLSIKFPLYDKDKNIYAICGISTDISERIKQEEQIRRSQKMDAIGQLTGGIAHDFNNQLGIIIGYLDFLKEHTLNDEGPSKWVKTSTNATLRCMDLTRQLLSFSRTQSNEKIVVDINTKLKELDTMFSRSVTPAIDVEYFLSDDLWLTKIDPGEFQDAILNLVLNARDAMPGGGKLLIETSNKHLDAESAVLSPDAHAGDYLQIALSDTGSGMDRATQERAFEPFYTTKPKGKGTGLGMSMVYGFIKRYRGFIKIYSEVDTGTTIRLYLPRSGDEPHAGTTVTSADKKQLPRGNETILIVDDEIDLLHLAEQYLVDLGYNTYLAKDAKQALDILAKQKDIDLLFSDVVMPGGTNGYELAQQALAINPALKVLMTSGFTSKTIASNSPIRFKIQLLSKPYLKADLAVQIRHVLDKDKDNEIK